MTILGAMKFWTGIIATMTIEEATDADIFLAFVEQVLCPALKQGDLVVINPPFTQGPGGARQDRNTEDHCSICRLTPRI